MLGESDGVDRISSRKDEPRSLIDEFLRILPEGNEAPCLTLDGKAWLGLKARELKSAR